MINYCVLFHGPLMIGDTISSGSGASSISLQRLGGAVDERRYGRDWRTQERVVDAGTGAVYAADCEDSGKLTPASIG
jgi:hypothetical protein